MIGAVSRIVPRFAGGIFSKLRGILPASPGEAAFSFLPDLGFAALGAAMAPGAAPEIGFTGTSPAERAGIFGYELFANGLLPSMAGRSLGKVAGKVLRVKDYGPLMGGGEMALQMTTPLLIANPISSGVYERLQSAQTAANEQMIEAEVRRRAGLGGGPSIPAANGIRPMSGPSGPDTMDDGYATEDPQLQKMRAILAGASLDSL